MSITRYFVPSTTRESANAATLEAGKAAAEAVIMSGKDEIAGRKRKRASTARYDEEMKTKIAKHALIFSNKSALYACALYRRRGGRIFEGSNQF